MHPLQYSRHCGPSEIACLTPCSHRGLRSPSGRQRLHGNAPLEGSALWTFRGWLLKHGDLPGLLDGESGRHRHPGPLHSVGALTDSSGMICGWNLDFTKGWEVAPPQSLPSPTAVLSKVFWVRLSRTGEDIWGADFSTRLIFW